MPASQAFLLSVRRHMARRMPSASSSHKASMSSPLRQGRTRHMLGRCRVLLYTLPVLTPQRARPVEQISPDSKNPFRRVPCPRSLARISTILPTGLPEASFFFDKETSASESRLCRIEVPARGSKTTKPSDGTPPLRQTTQKPCARTKF